MVLRACTNAHTACRGKDVGALIVRRKLNAESNLCFGEGGAGTWSDGKLSTKIGSNTNRVRGILNTLVEFGAPESILVDAKPHIGTDKLVKARSLGFWRVFYLGVCCLDVLTGVAAGTAAPLRRRVGR
jgi:hypothetical protein